MSKQMEALLKQAEQSVMILKSNSAAKHEMYETLLNRYEKLLHIVKRTSLNSCCLCCDTCLACDALEVLKEVGEIKGIA